jgi:ABC-type antimicrobial peptide transport system permease subunit
MVRLGLRLTLRSGREALVRLIVTATAVAIGVTVLLAVLADFNAFRSANDRPCWECTQGPQVTAASARPTAGAELWNYGNDIYAGQTIERLQVAALGPGAPVPPGIRRLPRPGQFYASPALAALLRTVPADELGDRFPGRLAGTISSQALSGPDDLVVMIGRTPAQLTATAQTIQVTKIARFTDENIWTPFFRNAFIAGALAFLFPILVLIGTATRLAAARLEERYAALRLVGSTTGQISVIAAVDAVVSALLGVVAGIAVFTLVRPLLADTAVTSIRYYSGQVSLTGLDYAAVIVAVPVAAALSALVSLRRVRISPLGVSRRVTPRRPGLWRILPLLAGAGLFSFGVARTGIKSLSPALFLGLFLVMIGLLIGGPWLTERAAWLLGRPLGGASALLAARRLSDRPTAAFRSVRGLVLAVFLGTVVAGILPAVQSSTATPAARALSNVLADQFTFAPVCGNDVNCTGGGENSGPSGPNEGSGPGQHVSKAQEIGANGLPPQAGAQLIAELRAIRGARVFPIWSPPPPKATKAPAAPKAAGSGGPGPRSGPGHGPVARGGPGPGPGAGAGAGGNGIMTCASFRQLAVLGQCAPGRTAVLVNAQNLFGDNPSFSTQKIASSASPAAPADYASLPLQAVLVKVSSPAVLERVRTLLATHTPLSESGSAPRTFGEAVAARTGLADNVERLIYIAVVLTLLVAGCSLAVAAGGGLMERRRPFSLLRVSGTPVATLRRVMLLETALPLVVATVVAAGFGYGIAVLTVGRLTPSGAPVPAPGSDYYLLMGTGLVVAFAVILLTLPLMKRMTSPASARFE